MKDKDKIVNINHIVENFFINSELKNYHPHGNGHINDTYIVHLDNKENNNISQEKYILQRINTHVFKTPSDIMNNITIVSDHIKSKLLRDRVNDIDRKVLTVIPSINGDYIYIDDKNNHWRVYKFIEGTETFDYSNSQKQLYTVAASFGKFLTQLSDLSSNSLSIIIPDFHNTEVRFEEFKTALKGNAFDRKKHIKKEIQFLNDNLSVFKNIENIINNGSLPLRVTHNDTKINNVLLDRQTGEGLCVVDLDTIMPGYSIFDFGDLVRSAIRNASESEKDLSKIFVDLDRFRSITRGFLSETREILTKTEIDNMVTGSIVITMMIGVRFLTDYLNGDKYFKTSFQEHNLARCRVQFKLVESLLEKKEKMEEIVRSVI